MRLGVVIVGVVLLALAAVFVGSKIQYGAPHAALAPPLTALGRTTPFDVDVTAGSPGLRQVVVRLHVGGTVHPLVQQDFPKTGWRGSGVTSARVHVAADLGPLAVQEGPATIEVLVDTWGWRLWPFRNAPTLTAPVAIDLTPPTVELLTPQHHLRLGGMDLALFRVSPDTVESGVQVDPYFFKAVPGYFADPGVVVGFFAIPQNLTADVRPRVVARDAAGNQRDVAIPLTIKPRKFAERTLPIDDDFLTRKVPEIQQSNRLTPPADPVQGYLAINRDLRQQNEATIKQVTATSEPRPLWDGPFRRQTNAAPLSSFADRRTYTYKGEVIDHQTHLGFDLASLKLAPVEAEQNGIVVFAGNLGIYGNAVILDHGLGVFSLYGHLSSLTVQKGQQVKTGETLGQTGETGLAGGDHLHFSVLLQGVHVDPVEWWDPHWLKDRVTAKLTMFPAAAGPAPVPAAPQAAVTPAAPGPAAASQAPTPPAAPATAARTPAPTTRAAG